MKLLSVAIPSYNSEAYLEKCVESLLPGGDKVEILIINDGSTDRTKEIAEDYEKRYPDIVRAVTQENKGHGGAVNTGIRLASGLFFKVVDSDDWVKKSSYLKILKKLEEIYDSEIQLDMLIANYVYEKQGAKHKKTIEYTKALPQGKIFTWDDTRRMGVSTYLLMHSIIYRTQLLKECGLQLPEHTFYVDNIFIFQPLPYVKTMYYMNEDFYRYYIGREDQSVNEKVMISRVDQQMKINKIMIDIFAEQKFENKRLKKYMMCYLDIITSITSVLLILSKKKNEKKIRRKLLNYVREKDDALYKHLSWGITRAANLPGVPGRFIVVTGYRICQKLFGFN